jgi:methylenetetrahydrofolate dehydrogenase (NADP+)/methenyltetrahydrofolate cyclohydrolase
MNLLNKIIDGKKLAKELRLDLKNKIQSHQEKPTLAVILVGHDPASQIYVAHKEKACLEVGFNSQVIKLNEKTTQENLQKTILKLNKDPYVHGILVQLPLPKHLDPFKTIETINPLKDVDGLTSYNQGLLIKKNPYLIPCTPKGVLKLIKSVKSNLRGLNACVVGRSILVGTPMSLILQQEDTTVTLIHAKSQNPQEYTQKADILVVCAGVEGLITKNWIKEGAIIIDVGIHKSNDKLHGDVNFEDCFKKCGYITPVPGGVGPMTIAMLMENTYLAYLKQRVQTKHLP